MEAKVTGNGGDNDNKDDSDSDYCDYDDYVPTIFETVAKVDVIRFYHHVEVPAWERRTVEAKVIYLCQTRKRWPWIWRYAYVSNNRRGYTGGSMVGD